MTRNGDVAKKNNIIGFYEMFTNDVIKCLKKKKKKKKKNSVTQACNSTPAAPHRNTVTLHHNNHHRPPLMSIWCYLPHRFTDKL